MRVRASELLVTQVALPAQRKLTEVHRAEDDRFLHRRLGPDAFRRDRARRGWLASISRHVGAMEAVALEPGLGGVGLKILWLWLAPDLQRVCVTRADLFVTAGDAQRRQQWP